MRHHDARLTTLWLTMRSATGREVGRGPGVKLWSKDQVQGFDNASFAKTMQDAAWMECDVDFCRSLAELVMCSVRTTETFTHRHDQTMFLFWDGLSSVFIICVHLVRPASCCDSTWSGGEEDQTSARRAQPPPQAVNIYASHL
jgi:hypothetical protein